MPYRIHDGMIECDTADEARALVGSPTSAKRAKTAKTGRRRRRSRSRAANSAVKQAWAAAKKLAKKEGMSVMDARSKLAKAKG